MFVRACGCLCLFVLNVVVGGVAGVVVRGFLFAFGVVFVNLCVYVCL